MERINSKIKTLLAVVFLATLALLSGLFGATPQRAAADGTEKYTLTLSSNFASEAIWSKDDVENIPVLSERDVVVTDNATGEEVFPEVVIEVKTPTANAFVAASTIEPFAEYGVYEIRYTVKESGVTVSNVVTRRIDVVDGVKPELIVYAESAVINAAPDEENGGSVRRYFRAYVNEELLISPVYAYDRSGLTENLTDKIVLSASLERTDGSVSALTGIEQAYQTDRYGLSFTPSEAGIYTLNFSVSDGWNIARRVYVIDVRASWVLLKGVSAPPTALQTGQTLSCQAFSAVDIYGTQVDAEKTVSLVLNGQTVATSSAGLEHVLLNAGEYELKYVATKGDAVAEKTYTFTVTDKTKPVLTVSGKQIVRAYKGDRVQLPKVTVADNDDTQIAYVLKITLGERNINFYGNTFRADKCGTYLVKYTATDSSGNVTEYSYKIKVEEGKVFSPLNVTLLSLAVIGVGGIVALTIIKKNKKNKDKSEDDRL